MGELELVGVRQEVVLVHVEGELLDGLIVASWREDCSSSKQVKLPAPQVVSMGLHVPSMKTTFQACGRSPTSNESPGSCLIGYLFFGPMRLFPNQLYLVCKGRVPGITISATLWCDLSKGGQFSLQEVLATS